MQKIPKELENDGGFAAALAAPPLEMLEPSPELLKRMEQDRILAEMRKPIAALFQSGNQDGMNYRIYVPESQEQEMKYPLVLFLHGAGERGDDNVAQLTAYEGALIWVREQLEGAGEKCFVLAPQCPETSTGWQEKELLTVSAMLDHVMKEHLVDENRLYLTGMSMGGGGCWRMNYICPERFAAIVPICSGAGFENREINPVAVGQAADGFYGKKLWLFHATDDFVVSPESSRCLTKALEQRGEVKGVDFFYTEYPVEMELGHGSWISAYENRIMRRWLFEQTLAPETPVGPPLGPDGETMGPPPELADAFRREKEHVLLRRRDYVPRFQSHTINDKGIEMQYRLFVPEKISSKIPLVVMLHGIGECGVNTTEPLTANDGVLDWVKAQDEGRLEPCFVLAPQSPLPIPGNLWEEEYLQVVEHIVEGLVEEGSVDESRIYVAGLSLGGYDAWNLSRMYPERYAAVVSCCPACLVGSMFNNRIDEYGLLACGHHLKDKPLWMFHAEDDPAVPVEVTRQMDQLLCQQTGKGKHHTTIYPTKMYLGHGSWEKAFKDNEMIRWLMQQRRK